VRKRVNVSLSESFLKFLCRSKYSEEFSNFKNINLSSELSIGRVVRLHEVGVELGMSNIYDAWLVAYEDLIKFKKKYGHCRVRNRQGKLGNWVRKQRAVSFDEY